MDYQRSLTWRPQFSSLRLCYGMVTLSPILKNACSKKRVKEELPPPTSPAYSLQAGAQEHAAAGHVLDVGEPC